jgi:hypothetical protein
MACLRRSLTLLIALVCSLALAQETATIRGPDIVKAGEQVKLDISVDQAPNFEGSGVQIFVTGPGSYSVNFSCALPPGEKVCHSGFRFPADVPSGTAYVSLAFYTGSRQIELPSNKLPIQVVSNPGLIFPTRAEVLVNPSQTQLLRREAARLQEQLQTLKATVANAESASRRDTTKILGAKVLEELNYIETTGAKFRDLGEKSQSEAAQAFFDDLRIGYTELLHELDQDGRTTQVTPVTGKSPFQEGSSSKKRGMYSLAAQAVFRVFEVNELAYNLVADTASLTFNLEVNSTPQGATISYRRRGDPYKQHSSPTNSILRSLPLAIWIVRFQEQGYRDLEVEFNPFVEPNRVITASLTK